MPTEQTSCQMKIVSNEMLVHTACSTVLCTLAFFNVCHFLKAHNTGMWGCILMIYDSFERSGSLFFQYYNIQGVTWLFCAAMDNIWSKVILFLTFSRFIFFPKYYFTGLDFVQEAIHYSNFYLLLDLLVSENLIKLKCCENNAV